MGPSSPARNTDRMTKHSKNRTAAPVFSYAERQGTNFGSKKQRLGRDSLRNFDACTLCLQRVRDARMCEEGHLFCQECIVTNLLSQKREIKRQTLLLEKLKEEEEVERQLARQQARERVFADFEKLQNGGAASRSSTAASTPSASSSSTTRVAGSNNNGIGGPATPSTSTSMSTSTSTVGTSERGVKRKFALDDTEVSRVQAEQEEQAMKLIEREQLEKSKTKLLSEKKKPIVALKREGTGYAGGGMAEVKRFQV